MIPFLFHKNRGIIHKFKLGIALFLKYPGEIYAKGMNDW
jgi:hypothetical protein